MPPSLEKLALLHLKMLLREATVSSFSNTHPPCGHQGHKTIKAVSKVLQMKEAYKHEDRACLRKEGLTCLAVNEGVCLFIQLYLKLIGIVQLLQM